METIIKPFQLGIAAQLIDQYKGDMPFSNYFAEQCKLHRNWGSRDRKIYRQACYAYLRLGFAIQEGSTESNIQFALQNTDDIIQQLDINQIFPHKSYISGQVDFERWTKSLLFQKPVYLCMVKGHEEKVKSYLSDHQINYEIIKLNTLRVTANTKCDEITENGWAWIMDISSQQAAEAVKFEENDSVWDCCSGAGGKALYLTNNAQLPFRLTCSDARFSILENLKARFQKCHLQTPAIELCDLTGPFQSKERFDVIVADVPCSGSGTWGRTPENITRTDFEKIIFYSKLQRTIIDNARKNLKNGGRIYYITCSVFKEENDLNIRYFEEKSGLKLLEQKYINTAGNNSDWLYCAEMVKM